MICQVFGLLCPLEDAVYMFNNFSFMLRAMNQNDVQGGSSKFNRLISDYLLMGNKIILVSNSSKIEFL